MKSSTLTHVHLTLTWSIEMADVPWPSTIDPSMRRIRVE